MRFYVGAIEKRSEDGTECRSCNVEPLCFQWNVDLPRPAATCRDGNLICGGIISAAALLCRLGTDVDDDVNIIYMS